MAFSSEIIAKLGINTDAFSRGLERSKASVDKFGGEVASTLQKKLSGSDIFRGLLQGLGIGSAQQIAEKIVEPFRKAAEFAEKLAGYTERSLRATEALIKLRQTDQQELNTMLATYEKMAKQLEAPAASSRLGSLLGGASKVAGGLGFGIPSALLALGEKASANAAAEDQEKRAKVTAEMGELSLEIEQKRSTIQKKTAEERQKLTDAEFKAAMEANAEERRRGGALKDIRQLERGQHLEKLTGAEKLAALQEDHAKRAQLIARYEKFGGKDLKHLSAGSMEELLELKKEQLDLERLISEETDKQKKNEQDTVKAVEDRYYALQRIGRGDTQLSDRELARKRMEIEADIERRRASGLAAVTDAAAYDPFLFVQRQELDKLSAEQNLRRTTRQNARFFGEEAAFGMSGMSEQRFREIIQEGSASTDQILGEIRDLFRTGKARTGTISLDG